MSGTEKFQHDENMPGIILTLAEFSENQKESYPIVVRVVPKEYEIPTLQELPGDSEILLEKPRWLQFVLVRILDLIDDEKIKKEKGEDFVKKRKACVGKKFLIPVCYPGTFKLLNKPGPHRYVSVSQIIKDLPRYIRINQETTYTPPEQPHATSTLPAGTKLEVKNVQIVGKVRYIKCKTLKKTYAFREDFPMNCTTVDDPDEHTLLNLAGEFVLLPKDAQFENVRPDDVVLKNGEEASSLVTLFDGPIKILKSFIRRNVYTAWMKREGTHRQTVGLVPRQIWTNQLVQLKTFQNEANKQEYIRQHFGDNLDSSFVVNGLYMLQPVETDVTWLIGPTTKTEDDVKPEDYEVVEKNLVDYENVMRIYEKMVLVDSKKESDEEDYENPAPPPPTPRPAAPPRPRFPPRRSASDEPKLLLPVAKPKKEDILKMIKQKARLGFDKVHEQLLKRTKQKQQAVSKSALDKKTDQSREDFYSYTVEELVECLKMCKLDKLAIICSENKLDGAFFRNVELNDLKSDPFFLSNIDFVKVKKLIEEGWRPKTEYAVK